MPCRALAPCLVLAGLLAASLPAGAAEDEPQTVDVVSVRVRPGSEAAFDEFIARLAEARRRTEAGIRWRAYGPTAGERTWMIVLRRGTGENEAEWAQLTPASLLERAFGAAEARRVLALREQSVERIERSRLVERVDASAQD